MKKDNYSKKKEFIYQTIFYIPTFKQIFHFFYL